MAKVFISYARPDRRSASDLALALEGLGHRVWWDANLLANEEFTTVIERELEQSDVVAVIWTPTSVQSRFVKAEAHKALGSRKLLGLLGPGAIGEALPVPFNVQHCVAMDDLEAIGRSIQAVLLEKAAKPASQARQSPTAGVVVASGNRLFDGGVTLIRRMAQILVDLTQDVGVEPQDAEMLRSAIGDLLHALDTFVAEVAPNDAFTFDDRFLFRRMMEQIGTQRPAIIKEKNWLDSYSSPGVIENAKAGLCQSARSLLAACG